MDNKTETNKQELQENTTKGLNQLQHLADELVKTEKSFREFLAKNVITNIKENYLEKEYHALLDPFEKLGEYEHKLSAITLSSSSEVNRKVMGELCSQLKELLEAEINFFEQATINSGAITAVAKESKSSKKTPIIVNDVEQNPNSIVIMPVQRLPRYALLLEGFLKTSKLLNEQNSQIIDSATVELVRQTLDEVKQKTIQLNIAKGKVDIEKIFSDESKHTIKEIQKLYENYEKGSNEEKQAYASRKMDDNTLTHIRTAITSVMWQQQVFPRDELQEIVKVLKDVSILKNNVEISKHIEAVAETKKSFKGNWPRVADLLKNGAKSENSGVKFDSNILKDTSEKDIARTLQTVSRSTNSKEMIESLKIIGVTVLDDSKIKGIVDTIKQDIYFSKMDPKLKRVLEDVGIKEIKAVKVDAATKFRAMRSGYRSPTQFLIKNLNDTYGEFTKKEQIISTTNSIVKMRTLLDQLGVEYANLQKIIERIENPEKKEVTENINDNKKQNLKDLELDQEIDALINGSSNEKGRKQTLEFEELIFSQDEQKLTNIDKGKSSIRKIFSNESENTIRKIQNLYEQYESSSDNVKLGYENKKADDEMLAAITSIVWRQQVSTPQKGVNRLFFDKKDGLHKTIENLKNISILKNNKELLKHIEAVAGTKKAFKGKWSRVANLLKNEEEQKGFVVKIDSDKLKSTSEKEIAQTLQAVSRSTNPKEIIKNLGKVGIGIKVSNDQQLTVGSKPFIDIANAIKQDMYFSKMDSTLERILKESDIKELHADKVNTATRFEAMRSGYRSPTQFLIKELNDVYKEYVSETNEQAKRKMETKMQARLVQLGVSIDKDNNVSSKIIEKIKERNKKVTERSNNRSYPGYR